MKSKGQIQIDFSDGWEMAGDFMLFENIITDRGSKYSVVGGRVTNRDEVKAFLKKLKSNKKYAKATHNSWAVRISHDHQIWETKSDDGEVGAGAVILRILQKENFTNGMVVVTRWFGGVMLGTDRFKHLQDATKYFLEKVKN